MKHNLEYNNRWKDEEYTWRRSVSEGYNSHWINFYGLKEFSGMSLEKLKEQGLDITDSKAFQVVWLQNIDRLMDMLPVDIQPSQYHLIDAGCGSGISTIYFLANYPFKTFKGCDFSEVLIKAALKNLDIFYTHSDKSSKSIDFVTKNVKDLELEDSANLVFMYNPFGFKTAKQFILNNLSILKKNRSIIALSNDEWIKEIINMQNHQQIIRNEFHNLSLVIY